MVRDMNPAVATAENLEDNMTVYLKGAPEKVIRRCHTMLLGFNADNTDNEVVITGNKVVQAKIDLANEKFGGSGERVLAFARK